MELTTEQLQEIDTCLKKKGIKHWDIRLEMVDHIVTDIEQKMDAGFSYTNALNTSFTDNNYHGDLIFLDKERLLQINKIVRTRFFKEIKRLLTSFKSALPILFCVLLYLLIMIKGSNSIFKYVSLTFLFTPIIYGFISFFYHQGVAKKSAYLTYSSFYIFFAFLILNGIPQFFRPEGFVPVSVATFKLVLFSVVVVNSVFSLAGIFAHNFYLKKFKNFEKYYIL